MLKMEVFFDYECPYCKKAYEWLAQMLPRYPHVDILWRPTEAHPRPEVHGLHSDLCLQGLFFAQAQGADVHDYHTRMFRAAQVDRVNIENIDALVPYVVGLLDPDAFRASLEQGEYADTLNSANDYAYEQSGVWALPAYRMNGKRLDSAEGIGVSRAALEAFLEEA